MKKISPQRNLCRGWSRRPWERNARHGTCPLSHSPKHFENISIGSRKWTTGGRVSLSRLFVKCLKGVAISLSISERGSRGQTEVGRLQWNPVNHSRTVGGGVRTRSILHRLRKLWISVKIPLFLWYSSSCHFSFSLVCPSNLPQRPSGP